MASPRLTEFGLHRVMLSLDRPYPVAFTTFTELDAIVVEALDERAHVGWGEVTIVPLYTNETVESGWKFCKTQLPSLLGRSVAQGKRALVPHLSFAPHAVSAVMASLEMLDGDSLLRQSTVTRVPVLAPVRNIDQAAIAAEVEDLVAAGHRTLKVKVGFAAVESDLARLQFIAQCAAGRARLRVDANQGYDVTTGVRFAKSLDPETVELFEQPCHMTDWEGNTRVAAQSAVPVMLDESVYTFDDIRRAAELPGVGFVKLVMEKPGGLRLTLAGLELIRAYGMEPVIGNGAASDCTSWMEACLASRAVAAAGEMHGFLKLRRPLLTPPLRFDRGDIVLDRGYSPTIDRNSLNAQAVASERFHL